MDNIIEKFIYVLMILVLVLSLYYMYMDFSDRTAPSSVKHQKKQSDLIPDKSPNKKKIMYNDYYKDPDLIESGEILDDYIPTEEDIEEYKKQENL